MDEIKRLQKLAGIKEIKINKPINKKELLKMIFNESGWLLLQISHYPLNTLLSNEGFNNLDEYIEIMGYEPKFKPLIEQFYLSFKPNEISCFSCDDSEGIWETDLGGSYKKVMTNGDDDGHCYICLHNL